MLAQFQSLYPNGSLISELVQIFQGKYIVRASVLIEGVTRATGMASAETIEAAEDQARTRALMVLGMTNAPQESVSQAQPNPSLNAKGGLSDSTYSPTKNEDFVAGQWSVAKDKEISIPPTKKENIKLEPVKTENLDTPAATSRIEVTADIPSASDTYSPNLSEQFALSANRQLEFDTGGENLEVMSGKQIENPTFSGISASNVTPFTPRNYSLQEDTVPQASTSKRKKKAEPVDLSDVIAKTDVELQRLGWTPEQGREHLITTYGKRGRTLLTEEELHGFLKYLQSQPDPIAGF
ncbi:MAG: hypothetical protein RMX96_05420 [Nostoc sp. ChiSLP02]|nr:hypothetical protein [Nostoc sp. DedSLP05]MDZ8103714.1 hypothetical protein [Nostoc sp. DedSLP01]MDZ8184289.1 hypothetical protein [Nostoc sp. ChiSLP02]